MKKNILYLLLLLPALLYCTDGKAQLKGDHLLGDYGLEAGTQPPPSIVVSLPLYWYRADKLVDNGGDAVGSDLDVGAFLEGIGGSFVTNLKILGANYGASLLFCFATNKLEGNLVDSQTSFTFSDTYVQPLQLGWHLKRADFTFGYALYMPTGSYKSGGDNNSGLGMWTNEFSAGTTVYFDKKKSFNFSTVLFYELHSKKRGTDTKVGDILTLEGGIGKSFFPKVTKDRLPMPIGIGAVYYAQFKVTDDRIALGDKRFSGDRDRIYGLGVEANILYPKTKTALSFRWLGEMGARNRFQGNTFLVTINQFLKLY